MVRREERPVADVWRCEGGRQSHEEEQERMATQAGRSSRKKEAEEYQSQMCLMQLKSFSASVEAAAKSPVRTRQGLTAAFQPEGWKKSSAPQPEGREKIRRSKLEWKKRNVAARGEEGEGSKKCGIAARGEEKD